MRARQAVALIGLVLSLQTGCSAAGEHPPDYSLDHYGGTSHETEGPGQARPVAPEVVDAALDRWDDATGLRHAIVRLRVEFVPWLGDRAAGCDEGAHACYDHYGARVVVRDDGDGYAPEQWLVHEYGHALLGPCRSQAEVDAQHAIPGVMAAWWDGGISPELVRAVCERQVCTWQLPEEP